MGVVRFTRWGPTSVSSSSASNARPRQGPDPPHGAGARRHGGSACMSDGPEMGHNGRGLVLYSAHM